MDTIIIDIDATGYKNSLSHFVANLIFKIKSGIQIPVSEIFKTDAFTPTNSTADSQLASRKPFNSVDGLWISESNGLPLHLQYKVFQSGNPIRLDIAAKENMIVETSLYIENYKLQAIIKSDVTLAIRDSLIIEGQEIKISDLLELRQIEITEKAFCYKFCKKDSLEIYLTINAIYNTAALDVLENRTYKISFYSSNSLKQKLVRTFLSSIDKEGCKPPQPSGPHTLFARSFDNQSGNGTCFITPNCLQRNPDAPFDIQLGCYPTYEDASKAMNNHPMCGLESNDAPNPFELAKVMISNKTII